MRNRGIEQNTRHTYVMGSAFFTHVEGQVRISEGKQPGRRDACVRNTQAVMLQGPTPGAINASCLLAAMLSL